MAKSGADVRAERRAYDGAPPVIPHPRQTATCTECHNRRGVEVQGLGFAPPTPHSARQEQGALRRCGQCHVPQVVDAPLVENRFTGLPQNLRRGERAHPLAPPTIPHGLLMRENCLACHDGPAAREEIRTSHPERVRCRQCHVPTGRGQYAAAKQG